MTRHRPLLGAVSALGLLVTLAVAPADAIGAGKVGPAGICEPALSSKVDFNGDGKPDLATGAPFARVGGKVGAGAVIVAYNVRSTNRKVRLITQNTAGVLDQAEPGDHFGWSLATADFNCDGRTDLAIGAPDEDRIQGVNSGLVTILYGSPTGLKGVPGYKPIPCLDCSGEAGDQVGYALAAVDGVNIGLGGQWYDGRPDLAIGAPGAGSGSVSIVAGQLVDPGLDSGTITARGVHDATLADGSRFGSSLAGAELDGDKTDDLVIGVPGLDSIGFPSNKRDIGGVSFVLNVDNPVTWRIGDGLPGAPRAGDSVGHGVAAGDMDGDGKAEIAVGAPGRDTPGRSGSGVVFLIGNTGSGPDGSDITTIDLSTAGVPGVPAAGDELGWSVAMGNVGRSALADLAIGIPGRDVGGKADAGAVAVIYGGASTGHQLWTQDSKRVPDRAEAGDAFGTAVAIAQHGAGAPNDLVVGAPRDDVNVSDSGGVLVLYSAGSPGLRGAGATWLTRKSLTSGSLTSSARIGFAVR